ncbi:uncharacterized protein [Haliotis asinina]|uniref:uncharacterized protein n=1 Tax=Haliotis asinina TaxID=109174 RepID=UPI00353189D6
MRTMQLIAKLICFLALPPGIRCMECSEEQHMNGISHPSVLSLPMCSLVKPQDTPDVCGADDNAYWREVQQCPVPIHIPWLCRLLDPPVTFRLGLLYQLMLVLELLVVTTSTFFLLLYLMVKLDRQRHLRNRNIRRRLHQLMLHVYMYCGAGFLAEIAKSVYVETCGWIGRQGMNIDEQRERLEERVEERLQERVEDRLQERVVGRLQERQVEAPCDCDPFAGIRRSHDVDDDQASFEHVYA